jgi:hypothetical protein
MSLVGVLTMRDGHIPRGVLLQHTSPTCKRSALGQTCDPHNILPRECRSAAQIKRPTVRFVRPQAAIGLVQPDRTKDRRRHRAGLHRGRSDFEHNRTLTESGEVITSRNVLHRLEYYSATAGGKKMVNLVKTLTYETLALVGVSIPQKLPLYNTLGIDFFHIQRSFGCSKILVALPLVDVPSNSAH